MSVVTRPRAASLRDAWRNLHEKIGEFNAARMVPSLEKLELTLVSGDATDN